LELPPLSAAAAAPGRCDRPRSLPPLKTAAAARAQRAKNRRQKHVYFYLFRASGKPVFLFEETGFLCTKRMDPA